MECRKGDKAQQKWAPFRLAKGNEDEKSGAGEKQEYRMECTKTT